MCHVKEPFPYFEGQGHTVTRFTFSQLEFKGTHICGRTVTLPCIEGFKKKLVFFMFPKDEEKKAVDAPAMSELVERENVDQLQYMAFEEVRSK
jgi:hypothetical protein